MNAESLMPLDKLTFAAIPFPPTPGAAHRSLVSKGSGVALVLKMHGSFAEAGSASRSARFVDRVSTGMGILKI